MKVMNYTSATLQNRSLIEKYILPNEMLYKYYFCNQRNIVIVLDLIKQLLLGLS